MGARAYGKLGCGAEGRLPQVHRTIRLPASLWEAVKRRGERDGRPVRWVVDEALDGGLGEMVQELRQLGLRGEVLADKLVRVPLDDNVIGRLNFARRQTGLPAVLLLRLCLARHVAGDKR